MGFTIILSLLIYIYIYRYIYETHFVQEKLRNLKPIVEDSAENEGDFWKLSSMET